MPDSKANPIWRFYREQRLNLPLPTAADVAGRTFVVTGGNTGLGYECAAHLVALGAARVVLGVRSVDKGEAARAAMEQAAGRTGVVQVWPVDLGSLASVEAFVERIASLERVDALVNNAGIELDRFATLEDGLETSLVVNVVGTLLLCLRALPVLAASAKKHGEQARMEIVSSGIIMGLTSESLDGLGGGNVFEALSKEETMEGQRYAKTKLLVTWVIRQLAELAPLSDTGVIIDLVAPGLCSTGLDRHRKIGFRIFVNVLRLLMGRTAEMGSRTLLHGAVAGPESHGQWLTSCAVNDDALPDWVKDKKGRAMQERTWADAVAVLAARGHRVDVNALLPKN